jgi:hypothetical protein
LTVGVALILGLVVTVLTGTALRRRPL